MRSIRAVPVLAAAAAVAAWLPFLDDPLTPDEGGFLLLGQHWSPGTSLYGDYWVDRPPLIIWLFSILGHAPSAVKALGMTAAILAVLLSGVLARQVSPSSRWAACATPVLALALVCSPLLGMPETDGELVALPFVLAGLICTISALRPRTSRQALASAVAAGVFAMAAALVKQNIIDVFVFAVAAFVVARSGIDRPMRRAVLFTGGSIATLAIVVGAAAIRGTSPAELWDAVVTFRFQAWGVIDASTPERTPGRMIHVGLAFLACGAAPILATTLWTPLSRRIRGRLDPNVLHLVAPAVITAVWEVVAAALGGSYWLHYLIGLVPGLLLLTALAGPAVKPRSLLTGFVALAVVVNGFGWTYRQADPMLQLHDERVAGYLHRHARPSDGVVVAFGHPNIVLASGLHSPYPDVWLLPARVHDPDLKRFRQVISGPSAPQWVVIAADSLDDWGRQGRAAQRYADRRYVHRRTFGHWDIAELRHQ